MFESSEGLLHWNTKISLQCRRRVPTKQWRTMDRSGRVQWGWVRLLRCHRALWSWFWFDHDIGMVTNISSLQCIGIVVSWYQEALVLWVVDMKWYCGQLDPPCLNCPLYSQWLADRERVKEVDQHQTLSPENAILDLIPICQHFITQRKALSKIAISTTTTIIIILIIIVVVMIII